MNRFDSRTRFAALVLLLALASALFVAAARVRIEHRMNRVELSMDYGDLLAFARSYGYDTNALLLQMRRAGLTSLALSEELGSALTSSTSADGFAISGAALEDAARLSPLSNPVLASLERSGQIRAGSVYLLVYNRAAFRRYMQQLPLHFKRSGIRVLSKAPPYVIALRTQIDYFNATALGVPGDQVKTALRFGFLVDPRFQNDERLRDGDFDAMLRDVKAGKWLSTAIFFGLRNQVLGFPNHVADAAAAIEAYKPSAINFGMIEVYDPSQAQKGYDALAKALPGRTVRVQTIGKLELDKMTVPGVVARYELGVRERNVRVVYLHPFAHRMRGLSAEMTNVEMIRELANDLRAKGFRLGRATPIPPYRGDNRIAIALAALAVPSLFVLLLGWYGWYRRSWAVAAYALTVIVIGAGYAAHHAILARSVLALAGALVFEFAAFTALAGAFFEEPAARLGDQVRRSITWTLIATGIALLGALVVVGILSAPLLMEEVEAMRGVKLVLALPPVMALALYLFSGRFNSGIESPRRTFDAPVRVYQLIAACAVLAAGALLLMRSGNQSDIAPSSLELSLRHHLTTLLSVRPRFKEFVIGFPAMMLLPALRVEDRRALGMLFAIGIGIGIGDVVDTFSHLHTPLLISLTRVLLGLIIGAIVGIGAIVLYRRVRLSR